jgi:phosphohistidine phosphatase
VSRQIWLLRHGEAEPHDAKPDAERRLTARGERQAGAAGAALARLGVELAACWTSPKVRARDTAKLAAESLNADPQEDRRIGDAFDVDVALELLAAGAEDDEDAKVLFVGHEPDFSQVVHDLTGARVDFKKGGIAAIRVTGRRRGELIVLLRPREVESLSLSSATD